MICIFEKMYVKSQLEISGISKYFINFELILLI